MSLFRPIIYQKNIQSINYQKLYDQGIRYLIVDLDNTLSKVLEKECSPETKAFVNNLSEKFTIIVASNNTRQRVRQSCQGLNVIGFAEALKPSKNVYRYFAKRLNYRKEEVAVIGDQIVTDIFMGNRLNVLTILVDPLSTKDLKITYFNRFIEKIIMKMIKFKKGVYYEKD